MPKKDIVPKAKDKIIPKDIDDTITIVHTKDTFEIIQKMIKKQNKVLLRDICTHYNWNYDELFEAILTNEKY